MDKKTSLPGKAILDYWRGDTAATLLVHNNYGEPEPMPVRTFFRTEAELSDLEQYAIDICRGHVLDVGAGAGRHSLILQQKFSVTAIDISPECVAVMRERGVKQALQADVFTYAPEIRFDTILLLMNGLGIAGNLQQLPGFLTTLKQLLASGGQILMDSCDVSYLVEDTFPQDRYVGEITYQFEYQGEKEAVFPWLYLDSWRLRQAAWQVGLRSQVIYEAETGEYLARLTKG